MLSRPAVEKGRHVPTPHRMKEIEKDQEAIKAAAEHTKSWVQAGMAATSKN